MFEQMPILIEQMKILASLIAIGFVAQRMKLLSNENIDNLSAILSKFIIPAMLLTIIPNGGSRSDFFAAWKFILCTVVIISCMFVTGIAASKTIKFKDEARRKMHAGVIAMGNAGFIGLPLVTTIFPVTGALPSAFYVFIEAVYCWCAGPILTDPSEGKKKINFKKLVTPLNISMLAGIVLLLLNVNLKGFVVWDTLTTIGGTTKYFASLYVGLNLGRLGFKCILDDKRIFLSSPFKLIIFPIVVYYVFGKTGIMSGDMLMMLVLFASTPTGMSLPLVADVVKGDKAYATAGTLLNTILCLVTIPLVMQLISYL